MSYILQPWQLLTVILVGWVQREQQKITEFNQAELEAVLKVRGKKRLAPTDEQRRVLAVKGKSLGRKALMELTTISASLRVVRGPAKGRSSFAAMKAQNWRSCNEPPSVGENAPNG